MLFNTRHGAILASISILAGALPLDTPGQIIPRQKNYSVINVDGGSTTNAQATTTIESIKTIEIVIPAPTITQEVTTTILSVAPAPTQASSDSGNASSAPLPTLTPTPTPTPTSTAVVVSSSSAAIETPKPIYITVTVPDDGGSTEYYDDGLWHTFYRVKTVQPAVASVVP